MTAVAVVNAPLLRPISHQILAAPSISNSKRASSAGTRGIVRLPAYSPAGSVVTKNASLPLQSIRQLARHCKTVRRVVGSRAWPKTETVPVLRLAIRTVYALILVQRSGTRRQLKRRVGRTDRKRTLALRLQESHAPGQSTRPTGSPIQSLGRDSAGNSARHSDRCTSVAPRARTLP